MKRNLLLAWYTGTKFTHTNAVWCIGYYGSLSRTYEPNFVSQDCIEQLIGQRVDIQKTYHIQVNAKVIREIKR